MLDRLPEISRILRKYPLMKDFLFVCIWVFPMKILHSRQILKYKKKQPVLFQVCLHFFYFFYLILFDWSEVSNMCNNFSSFTLDEFKIYPKQLFESVKGCLLAITSTGHTFSFHGPLNYYSILISQEIQCIVYLVDP